LSILLSKYLEIGRETTDLDFLARKISNQIPALHAIVKPSAFRAGALANGVNNLQL
jgi:hypothetical protein